VKNQREDDNKNFPPGSGFCKYSKDHEIFQQQKKSNFTNSAKQPEARVGNMNLWNIK
jgi:hypothetical protein